MSVTEKEIYSILDEYPKYDGIIGYKPIIAGHINDTYVVEYKKDNNSNIRFLLQRINTNVFKEPEQLMSNVIGVTDFLRKKIETNGGDPERETLTVFPTNSGKMYCIDKNKDCWRMYNFVEDSFSINEISNKEDFKNAALSFGNFQNLLADYPIETLYETIPNFHNTPLRFLDFKKAVEDNISGRKNNAIKEIDFALSRENDCSVVTDLIEKGELPIRVTHNDTKLNNVLFDSKTKKGLCVVDLDTVMPGSALYDFGDSIRFGANTAAEDEKDLSKVSISLDYFQAYVEGYLEAAGESLTDNEIKYMAYSAKLLTFECGIRFLGDYLNGDVYFKTDYPEHNLVRARTQFKLVAEIEDNYDKMLDIVKGACKSILSDRNIF